MNCSSMILKRISRVLRFMRKRKQGTSLIDILLGIMGAFRAVFVPMIKSDRFCEGTIDLEQKCITSKVRVRGKQGFTRVICPTIDDMAWVAIYPEKHLTLIDGKGKVIKTSQEMPDKICNAVCFQGDILVTFSRKIMKLTDAGETVSLFSDLSPLFPRDLCVTRNDELLVCLMSMYGPKNIVKVVRLNSNGKVIEEIQQKNPPLPFSFPYAVTSFPSGDIVILDDVQNERKVICLDGAGNHKFTWEGEISGKKEHHFVLSCLANTQENCVYILGYHDYANNSQSVYVLNNNGEVAKYVINQKHKIDVKEIVTDKTGRLWLGGEKGKLYVMA